MVRVRLPSWRVYKDLSSFRAALGKEGRRTDAGWGMGEEDLVGVVDLLTCLPCARCGEGSLPTSPSYERCCIRELTPANFIHTRAARKDNPRRTACLCICRSRRLNTQTRDPMSHSTRWRRLRAEIDPATGTTMRCGRKGLLGPEQAPWRGKLCIASHRTQMDTRCTRGCTRGAGMEAMGTESQCCTALWRRLGMYCICLSRNYDYGERTGIIVSWVG